MNPRPVYRLARQGRLFVSRAAVSGSEQRRVILRLLVDTGSTYTVIPVEVADRLGCDLNHPLQTVRMISANGIIMAPMVRLRELHCLGVARAQFPVVVHTLPPGIYVDGLLGMDFLGACGSVIDLQRGTVSVHWPRGHHR